MPNYPVIDRENCTYFIKGTCKACEKFCAPGAIRFDQKDEIITVKVGNIILATGYDLFDVLGRSVTMVMDDCQMYSRAWSLNG